LNIKKLLGLTATVKGSQTDESFFSLLKHGVIPALLRAGCVGIVRSTFRSDRCARLSPTNPAMLQLDGHSSRLTPAVAELLIAYNICAFIIPSHTSTIHQAADNGLQALTQRLYEAEVVVVTVIVSVCLIYSARYQDHGQSAARHHNDRHHYVHR
jgi:hypothetical protein